MKHSRSRNISQKVYGYSLSSAQLHISMPAMWHVISHGIIIDVLDLITWFAKYVVAIHVRFVREEQPAQRN